jgi:hypothetical protein
MLAFNAARWAAQGQCAPSTQARRNTSGTAEAAGGLSRFLFSAGEVIYFALVVIYGLIVVLFAPGRRCLVKTAPLCICRVVLLLLRQRCGAASFGEMQ